MNLFNSEYKDIPSWDIGPPQKEFARLTESGRVLDIGCGTGENALCLAGLGSLNDSTYHCSN